MLKKQRFIIFILIFLLIMFLQILFSSCSYVEKNNSENGSTDEHKISESTQDGTTGSETVTVTDSSTDEQTANSSESSGNEDINIIQYTDKKIQIKRVYTIYEDIFTGSINIDVNTETGKVIGYLFLGYMEVRLISGRSFPCENVIKGVINGTFNNATGELVCDVKSKVTGEGSDCFAGEVVLKLIGNLIEGEKLISGSYQLPSGNELTFILERTE